MAQENENRAEGEKVFGDMMSALSQAADLGIRALGAASLEIKEQRASLSQDFEDIDKAATALHAEASQRVENLKHNAQSIATAVKEAPGHFVDGVAAGAEAVETAYASADRAIKGAEKEAHDFAVQKAADGIEVAVAVKDKALELKEAGDHKLAEVRDGIGHAAVQAGVKVIETTVAADHAVDEVERTIKNEAVAVGGAIAHGTVIAHQNAVEGGVIIIENTVAAKDRIVEDFNMGVNAAKQEVKSAAVNAVDYTIAKLHSAISGLTEIKLAVNDVDKSTLLADGASPANTQDKPKPKVMQAGL